MPKEKTDKFKDSKDTTTSEINLFNPGINRKEWRDSSDKVPSTMDKPPSNKRKQFNKDAPGASTDTSINIPDKVFRLE